MKLLACILISVIYYSNICYSQDLSSEIHDLDDITDVNSVTTLDNENVLISGYQRKYVPYATFNGDPILKLSDADGAFIDSLSYPELSSLRIVSQMDNGRVLGIGSRVVSDRLFFVTIGDELEDLKINKYLDRDDNLTIKRISKIYNENNELILEATIIDNQNELKAKLTYDTSILEVVDIQVLPERWGNYYFLSNNTFILAKSIGYNRDKKIELSKYDSNLNILWKTKIDDILINALHEDGDGNIYIAGREDLNDINNGYEAVLISLDSNGIILNSLKIEGDPGPQLNPIKIAFSKILSYQDKLIVLGTNWFNADRITGYHNIIIAIYDKNLNEIKYYEHSVYGTWAWLIDSEISGNTIYGIVDSGVFESSFSYEFKVEISETSLIASEYIGEFSIYPNPTNEKIYLDLPHNSRVELFDMRGTLLYSQDNSNEIDVNHLTSGVYLVKYSNKNGSRTQRIVKE